MAEAGADDEKPDGRELIEQDPWLAPYAAALRDRLQLYRRRRSRIEDAGGLLGAVTLGHKFFGLNRGRLDGEAGIWYREWAPEARYLSLIGDFNDWDRNANGLDRGPGGVWSTFVPDRHYSSRLVHGSRIKVHVVTARGASDRIPAYARRVVGEGEPAHYIAEHWDPPAPHRWANGSPSPPPSPRIYEAHVGMSSEEGKVATFQEFRAQVLPRVADLGYNTIQLMAVMEHPYYGSFGYQVSNFYAVSSRFGTPEDLKALVDDAHGMGLRVIMDLVHSHAAPNTLEGLNEFDGTDHQYFHGANRGKHPAWGSLCFDYEKDEVERFLLSNVRYWLEEFRLDGFRFDGVTSMLYLDHGLGRQFTGYEDYFGGNVDACALVYLMLANELAHKVTPDCWTVAEDVSGMPGIARPVAEGGLGFDYRLAMGVPDYWIRLLETQDESWPLNELYGTLMNRRRGEKHIGYVESHDQALVGDKTIAFRLMDQEMYWSMSRSSQSFVVDRGIALHKIIRLLTFSLAGEGYLNFMGNEFGHPEWIDFPREGNAFSYQYARRQWGLVASLELRYRDLNAFDRAMQKLDTVYNLLADPLIEQLAVHEDTRQLVYRRGPLVFAYNLHPTESYAGLRIPVPDSAEYRCILCTDSRKFGGAGLVDEAVPYPMQSVPMYGRAQSIQIYLPARAALALAPATSCGASETRG